MKNKKKVKKMVMMKKMTKNLKKEENKNLQINMPTGGDEK